MLAIASTVRRRRRRCVRRRRKCETCSPASASENEDDTRSLEPRLDAHLPSLVSTRLSSLCSTHISLPFLRRRRRRDDDDDDDDAMTMMTTTPSSSSSTSRRPPCRRSLFLFELKGNVFSRLDRARVSLPLCCGRMG
ncbi:MAG: hypothetical protein WC483_00355 [Candidatus Paceibacterota bacterium]